MTVRLQAGLPRLRDSETFDVIVRVFRAVKGRFDARVVHFSVQSNHIHMIAEARHERALAKAMQGLLVRLSRALNRHWGRRGTVFADRYHSRTLRSPKEVRLAIPYVLHNVRRHGGLVAGLDRFSSAVWFDGWRELDPKPPGEEAPVSKASTWLLATGWRRHGRVSIEETPGPR